MDRVHRPAIRDDQGLGWTQFIHPDDLAENVRVWQQAIASGELFLFEHRFRRADGEYRWHISRALPMRDDAGKVLMWVGSNTDIDEQKQTANEMRKLAAELSEADRRKDEFLAMLAHELRIPLVPIRNAAEILRVKGPAAPELQWAREVIDRQVQQVTRLVDDLLDVSRITRGKIAELNPVEYLWAYLKQHELPHFCAEDFAHLTTVARRRLASMQRRTTLVCAFWKQAELPLW